MTNRNKGHWKTTQENTWALISFAEWLNYSGELNSRYEWAIALNGFRIADGSVSPNMLEENIDLEVDIGDLFMDEVNRISIAKDDGSGSLYYTAHLDVYLPVDQIEPIDRGIIIGREYLKIQVIRSQLVELGKVKFSSQGLQLLRRMICIILLSTIPFQQDWKLLTNH